MAEIRLQGARVGALVGKLKATGVPEHVRVDLEATLGRDPGGGSRTSRSGLRLVH